MKILIVTYEMLTMSGSPMYNYTLALELKKQGHDVDIFAIFSNNETRRNLNDSGVNIITKIDENNNYDLALVSHNSKGRILSSINANYIINICHSEYDTTESEIIPPIVSPKIDRYVAIRPSIKQHMIDRHGIDGDKIEVIYNGIDFTRFNKSKRKKHDGNYTKVVLPCCIHDLREKFLMHYISKASKDYRIYIYGVNFIPGFEKNFNEWATLCSPEFYIENCICDADVVAGILYGRINLEAKAMGIKSFVHDPDNPDDFYEFELSEEELIDRHDVSNVAKRILDLVPKTKPVNHSVDKNIEKLFTRYYDNNDWAGIDSLSGPGSGLDQTKKIIAEIPSFLKKYNIKSMLDIPCGDFYWMSRVDLSGVDYIGADVVPSIVERCKNIYPEEEFKVLDIINSELPKVDCIFCRDCLVHLPYEEIHKTLKNCKASGSKYLLVTSFKHHDNTDIPLGGWRPLNLRREPFNLNPIDGLIEGCTENDGIFSDKSLLLFDLKNMNI